jgi:hypothetical protein
MTHRPLQETMLEDLYTRSFPSPIKTYQNKIARAALSPEREGDEASGLIIREDG